MTFLLDVFNFRHLRNTLLKIVGKLSQNQIETTEFYTYLMSCLASPLKEVFRL
jgi:hypothetical protein